LHYMTMKFLEDVELHEIPYRFSYRKITTENYKGFYHCHQGMEFLYVHQGTSGDEQFSLFLPGFQKACRHDTDEIQKKTALAYYSKINVPTNFL
jgi:hypothetical protein